MENKVNFQQSMLYRPKQYSCFNFSLSSDFVREYIVALNHLHLEYIWIHFQTQNQIFRPHIEHEIVFQSFQLDLYSPLKTQTLWNSRADP